MTDFKLEDDKGKQIHDWRFWTRPKEEYQWKPGRSAMELARAWFTARQPQCPVEVESLLATHPDTRDLQLLEGRPEFVTPLPERGEGRNHDLMIRARRGDDNVTLCIEAKADEPFGELIGDYWSRVKESTKPTRAPERIEKLMLLVFGSNARPNEDPWKSLRYQLLTGAAGTLLQAARDKSSMGLFVIQEFRTPLTDRVKLQRNGDDYNRFIEVLFSNQGISVTDGMMYGPLSYPAERLSKFVDGYGPNKLDFFVGKCSFSW